MKNIQYLFLFIVIQIVIVFSCLNEDQYIHEECYKDKFEINNICYEDLDIDLKINDSERGIANLEFSTLCNIDSYEIQLKINESVSEDQCDHYEFLPGTKNVHTNKIIFNRGNNTSVAKCTVKNILKLKFIYTGCYEIIITGNKFTKSERKYLKTKYTKDIINLQIPVYARNDEHIFSILTNNNFYDNIYLNYSLQSTDESINDTIIYWETKCPVATNGDCNVLNQSTDVKCKTVMIENFEKKFVCNLKSITIGAYYLKIKILSEPVRCFFSTTSVWNENNSNTFHVYITEPKQDTALDEDPSDSVVDSQTIFIIILVIIIVLGFIIFGIFVRRQSTIRSRYSTVNSQIIFSNRSLNDDFHILLLYARDCDIVMETMQTFKQMLEENIQCNVYDIFDSSNEQELSNNPQNWILSKVSCPSERLKTLLVATRCGHIQLQYPTVLYKQPRYHDNLFPLAVDKIRESRHCTNNDSLFVLNFSADSHQEYESFVCFTPGRRFALPESLNELFAQLGCENIYQSESLQMFHEHCERIQDLNQMNPTYFTDVFNVQVNDKIL